MDYQDVEGWAPAEKIKYMYDLVKQTDAQAIVEIGVYGGKSLIPMAVACKEKGSGTCFGIDPWKKEASIEGWPDGDVNKEWWEHLDHHWVYGRWRASVEKYDVKNQIYELIGKSEQFHRMFKDECIDIFHLDGNHAEQVALNDVECWKSKVKIGGYWIFDDTNWPSTTKAIELLEKTYDLVQDFDGWRSYKRRV
jgi:hypothetical protein